MMEVFWLEQVAGAVPADDDWLSDREQATLVGLKVPKRRGDWRLGRWTAKQAVAAYLELPSSREILAAIEIRPAASGAPEAFLRAQPASVSISLSHSNGTAACAVARAGSNLGCDLETIEPRSDAFIADYFTAAERKIIGRASLEQRDLVVTILWSAKESALKALREGLRFDTRAVSAWIKNDVPDFPASMHNVLPPLTEWPELEVRHQDGQVFKGWWRCADGLVRTVVSDPTSAPPIPLKNTVLAKN